jgi:hypothetical protein
MVRRGSAVRARQRALQKRRKLALFSSAGLAESPVCGGYGAVCGAPRSRAPAGRSASLCSSTAACTAPITRAKSWVSIADGLPDFGFPLVIDPDDQDSAYVILLVADMDRTTPDGRVRVYETRDAGASWIERGDGLPQEDAYLTILRQSFARSGEGATMEFYFGATSGDVFGSRDAGATWFTAATKLPPVHSVRVA